MCINSHTNWPEGMDFLYKQKGNSKLHWVTEMHFVSCPFGD